MGANFQVSVKSGASSVPALRRAVAILDYVSRRPGTPTMAGLVRELGVPRSTAYGLVQAMEELGLLARDANATLRLGPYPLRWAGDFLADNDFVSVFREYFAEAGDLAPYTVTMTVMEGGDVVYVACANTSRPLGVTFRIGMRLPAAFTATGKALLAAVPDGDIDARFDGRFPAPMTSQSVTSLDELKRELITVRGQGFSIDDGQVREGMICLGTVVRDYSGHAVAGLALSLTRSEAPPAMIATLGATLLRAGQEMSRRLGFLCERDD